MRIRRMCQEEVESLLSHVEGRSVAGAIMSSLVDKSWTEMSRMKIWNMLEADEDLKNWTRKRLELEAEDDARVQLDTIKEERLLKKAMLEVEWMLRREMIVEDMEVGEGMMLMETLTEQIKLLDMWKDDMDTYVQEPNEETTCLEDEDEDMKEMNSLCAELGVEEMEQEVGPFAWG